MFRRRVPEAGAPPLPWRRPRIPHVLHLFYWSLLLETKYSIFYKAAETQDQEGPRACSMELWHSAVRFRLASASGESGRRAP
jgi:hypothetical protein